MSEISDINRITFKGEISENTNSSLPESPPPKLLSKFITVLAVVFTLYMFYATIYGPYKTTIVHRALFLVVMLFIFFSSEGSLKIGKKGKYKTFCKVIDWIFIGAAVISLGYVVMFYDRILGAMGATSLKNWEIFLGILILLCVLEATRRTSTTFFILAVLGMIYTMFGPYLPGIFNHPGMSLKRLIFLTAFIEEGIFGLGLSVASTYLFMFMLFGATLIGTGASQYLMSLANGLVGHHDGGAAKTAVIGSAAMGSVSGSSISNVVTTGSITIPLMKKLGFKPHVAAAVEVTASEGGQLMPPVMGAAAFLMAEMTGISYSTIAIAAIIPAFLYFFNAFFIVHFEAKKNGIKGLAKEDIPDWKKVLGEGWHVMVPIVLLFYLLMVKSNTAMYAGLFCIMTTIIAAQIRSHTRMSLAKIIEIVEKGVRDVAGIVAILAGLGMVSQAVVITGLGARLSDVLVKLAGGTTIGIVFISVFITLILGSGMTTPIAYSLVAMFVAPTLVGAGFPVLAAHLFLFFFAIKSGSTPPVAVVAAVASGIAGADFWKTAIKGTVFGSATYLVAFGYLVNPSLLLMGEPVFIVTSFFSACLGTLAMAGAIQGWVFTRCGKLERLALFVGAVCLIFPESLTDLVGMIVVGSTMLISYKKYQAEKLAQESLLKNKAFESTI
ncbi:MAG: TRAP transporter permease [Peptococcaceae bacterium]